METLRVGHVTLTMEQGGIENLILSLCRSVEAVPDWQVAKGGAFLRAPVVQHTVYCLDGGGCLLAELEKQGVRSRVYARKGRVDFLLILKLASAFRKDRLNVIHTHNEAAHFYGAIAARVAGIAVVINTEHSRHYIQESWRRRLEKRMLSWITDAMVTVSEELRQAALADDKIAPEKLAVVLNGVDLRPFQAVPQEETATLRRALGVPEAAKVVSIVARLHPIKNHALLFEAARLLVQKGDDLRLLLVGDGEERQHLEALSERLGIGKRTLFLGNRSDVPVILKASDVAVLCSLSEGLPLALLEAMAARTPVVVTRPSNRSNLVVDGVNGLVADDRPEALAAALSSITSQGRRKDELTETAFAHVTARYSIEETAVKYLSLYTGSATC